MVPRRSMLLLIWMLVHAVDPLLSEEDSRASSLADRANVLESTSSSPKEKLQSQTSVEKNAELLDMNVERRTVNNDPKESRKTYNAIPFRNEERTENHHKNNFTDIQFKLNRSLVNLSAINICNGSDCIAWSPYWLLNKAEDKPHLLIIPLSAIIVFIVAIVLLAIRWCNEDIKEADLKDMRYISSSGNVTSMYPSYGCPSNRTFSRYWYTGELDEAVLVREEYSNNTNQRTKQRSKRRHSRKVHSSYTASGRNERSHNRRLRNSSASPRKTRMSQIEPGYQSASRYVQMCEMSNITEHSRDCSEESDDGFTQHAVCVLQDGASSSSSSRRNMKAVVTHGKHSSSGYVSEPISSLSSSSSHTGDCSFSHNIVFKDQETDDNLRSCSIVISDNEVFTNGSFHDVTHDVDVSQNDELCTESSILIRKYSCPSDDASSDGYEQEFETAIETYLVADFIKSASSTSFADGLAGH